MYLTPDLVRSELDYEKRIYSNLNGRSVCVNFDPCYTVGYPPVRLDRNTGLLPWQDFAPFCQLSSLFEVTGVTSTWSTGPTRSRRGGAVTPANHAACSGQMRTVSFLLLQCFKFSWIKPSPSFTVTPLATPSQTWYLFGIRWAVYTVGSCDDFHLYEVIDRRASTPTSSPPFFTSVEFK
jgi:hypothetical protein